MSESLPDLSEPPFHLGGRYYPLSLRCSYCLEPLGTDAFRPGMRHMSTTGCRGGDVEVYPPEVEQLQDRIRELEARLAGESLHRPLDNA